MALAYGVTLLPFRVELKTLDGDPHAEQLVKIETSSARCSLSETRKLSVALEEPARSKTSLELRIGSDGVSKVVYLVVKDPGSHGHDLSTVSVTIEAEGSSVEHTWDVEDNLELLKKKFTLRAENRLPRGSTDRLAMDVAGPYERGPFLDDVFIASVGNATLGAAGTRELVLEELEAMRQDPETMQYFSGLNYMSLADHKGGSVSFPVAVYSPTNPEQNLLLDPLPREDSTATLAFLEGVEEPDFAQPQLAHATVRSGTSVLVSCPVEVTFTDAAGNRVGYTVDGHVNEFEEANSYERKEYLEADGTRAKFVELDDRSGLLEITAEADGSFSLDILYHQPDGTAIWVSWLNVPVLAGETLSFRLDADEPGQAGSRADGQVVAPALAPTTVRGQVFAEGAAGGGRRSGGGCSVSAATTPSTTSALALLVGILFLLVLRYRQSARDLLFRGRGTGLPL